MKNNNQQSKGTNQPVQEEAINVNETEINANAENITQVQEEAPKTEETPVVAEHVAILDIRDILGNSGSVESKLARIMKICADNIDESKIPLELCTNGELDRRLSLVYSKKVPAKKAKEAAVQAYMTASLVQTDTMSDDEKAVNNKKLEDLLHKSAEADNAYDELIVQEEYIKSFKSATNRRAGTVSSETADPTKMDQLDLGKLIRNYQSKKSNAKKAADAAKVDGNLVEMEKQLGLVEYWQNKVEEANKCKTDAPKSSSVTTSKITDVIAGLEAAPQTEETKAMIAKLKALL